MRRRFLIWTILLLPLFQGLAQEKVQELEIQMNEGTHWWIGITNHGQMMPIREGYHADINAESYGNQVQPLLLSDQGEYIWSEDAFTVTCNEDKLEVVSQGEGLVHGKGGTTLREAYLDASRQFFPPSGKLPDMLLVTAPQYNTWIELMYDQNQEDILTYARSIIDNGFPPGVLMIDDNWQEDYGVWKFHPARFPKPHVMMDSLHAMGFKVMLWVCPFVSPDSYVFRALQDKGYLMMRNLSSPAIQGWWNGYSGLLDLSNPGARAWFMNELSGLVETYDVDGFKFDAGDARYYKGLVGHRDISPNEHCRLYGELGLDFPLNEYRAMWKMGGQPLVERLRDKGHNWSDLAKIIPDMLVAGMAGYPFSCPDMIGGGEFRSFLDAETLDQDLIVRSAQVHALMPMMQFSVSPWRVLDAEHLAAVREAVRIRQEHISLIERLTREAAVTGEPVVRSLEYVFPHQGYSKIDDQFMLGDQVLVAPVIGNDRMEREVIVPPGKWKDWNGKKIKGPVSLLIDVKIDELPIFYKQ